MAFIAVVGKLIYQTLPVFFSFLFSLSHTHTDSKTSDTPSPPTYTHTNTPITRSVLTQASSFVLLVSGHARAACTVRPWRPQLRVVVVVVDVVVVLVLGFGLRGVDVTAGGPLARGGGGGRLEGGQ